jgi:GNAT superfamily N-acetyltransferase
MSSPLHCVGLHADLVHADLALAQRLERTEASANSRFVEARARVNPEVGAEWIEVAGAYAMFDGVQSPCTQTFGLGLFQMPTATEMERVERFFRQRNAAVMHEVSPLADAELVGLLSERGYRPLELSNVLFLPLSDRVPAEVSRHEGMKTRIVGEAERDLWARSSADGWREFTEVASMLSGLARVIASTEGTSPFLVELDGEAIATGALAIRDGVALFAGASTVPEYRRRGAQRALLESRFAYAKEQGCDLAMIVTAPGSASQRNAERAGFRVAYTRTKWLKDG